MREAKAAVELVQNEYVAAMRSEQESVANQKLVVERAVSVDVYEEQEDIDSVQRVANHVVQTNDDDHEGHLVLFGLSSSHHTHLLKVPSLVDVDDEFNQNSDVQGGDDEKTDDAS